MKLNMRLNLQRQVDKCENCGAPLSAGHVYSREINGVTHYFCCSHCADEFEGSGHPSCC
ncbi:MAG: transcriptional regulator [Metallosphaera yellowstonensis]|uniref:MYM-type Zinc finger protein with FCS sequence motif n=1 Tax=Metallosphaera yellowstonensis MK1 TaxID=671065 RepID=H2C1S4_9CREN|nr:transcriptional regulator [Metallosphaera yellowstonensis]EHP70195.1 MYM-type Zinc finger protein with FCS sequence motif [Metallosphaera yellowstonensis MK1]